MSERRRARIITVLNQKGGVGKSTLAFNIAQAAADFGKRGKPAKVLCQDLDSQGDFSQYLTGDLEIAKKTKTGVGLFLEGQEWTPMATSHPNIDLLHGHRKLDRYDRDGPTEDRLLDESWREHMRGLDYDYIVIDTPPAAGIRQIGPLCWADVAVIPIEP
ncbi:partial Sporulation initiation inhibitor protein Soj, partial [Rhodocyclaceae bacterium]